MERVCQYLVNYEFTGPSWWCCFLPNLEMDEFFLKHFEWISYFPWFLSHSWTITQNFAQGMNHAPWQVQRCDQLSGKKKVGKENIRVLSIFSFVMGKQRVGWHVSTTLVMCIKMEKDPLCWTKIMTYRAMVLPNFWWEKNVKLLWRH